MEQGIGTLALERHGGRRYSLLLSLKQQESDVFPVAALATSVSSDLYHAAAHTRVFLTLT